MLVWSRGLVMTCSCTDVNGPMAVVGSASSVWATQLVLYREEAEAL